MWPENSRITIKQIIVILMAFVLSVLAISSISAQDADPPTETPTEMPTLEPSPTPLPTTTPVPSITVSGLEPSAMTAGVGGTLTISGTNFTSSTTVSLNGSIALSVISQSETTLVTAVGTDVTASVYTVLVSDSNSSASTPLTITEPTLLPQVAVIQAEPSQITSGQSGTLSIIGANFSSDTTVRLVGFGFLNVTYINSGALTAALPANIPTGQYTIEVSDPAYGTASATNTLTVKAAATAATAAPTATTVPTATAVPGQPELVIRNFNANPAVIYPGNTTTLTFEVVNVGNRTAEGVVVSLGNGDFTPANGQSSLTLPDLTTYASYTVTLSVAAPMDATEGPHNIPIVLSSRDFSGEVYTDEAAVSVNIAAEPIGQSQVVLDSYQVTPNNAAPGESVTIQALFKNTGTETASQVLVQLDSANSVLIAGAASSAFPIGDMPAGSSAPIVMPLVVASTAESGAQTQSFTITYLQDGESQQITTSISLMVAEVIEKSPLLLLESYSSGQDDPLQPGQQFEFEMALQNAGSVDISDLLVTFGTVDSSSNSGSETGTSSVSDSTVTPSDSFAIYGSGGTALLGDLAAGTAASLTQGFIVSSDLTSGIHNLPITLQYRVADGTITQQTLNASLIVVMPPRIRLTVTDTLDDPLTAGEEYTLNLQIANLGSSQVMLTEIRATGENVTISEGENVQLDPMDGSDDTTENITFEAQSEGAYTITVEVDYIDDLNQTQSVTTTVSGEVTAAQPQPRQRPMPEVTQVEDENLFGRLLLGFLGFGG